MWNVKNTRLFVQDGSAYHRLFGINGIPGTPGDTPTTTSAAWDRSFQFTGDPTPGSFDLEVTVDTPYQYPWNLLYTATTALNFRIERVGRIISPVTDGRTFALTDTGAVTSVGRTLSHLVDDALCFNFDGATDIYALSVDEQNNAIARIFGDTQQTTEQVTAVASASKYNLFIPTLRYDFSASVAGGFPSHPAEGGVTNSLTLNMEANLPLPIIVTPS